MLFVNKTLASALLFKTVRNRRVPIYISSIGSGVPPPGRHALVPNGRVLVFFMAREAQTAFEVPNVTTEAYEVAYEGVPETTIVYNQAGMWEGWEEKEEAGEGNGVVDVAMRVGFESESHGECTTVTVTNTSLLGSAHVLA